MAGGPGRKIMRSIPRLAVAGLALLASGAMPREAGLDVLEKVQPGVWRLHEIGSRAAGDSMCVRYPRLLLQIHHRASQCARFVVSTDARAVTVHYTCPGAGYGRSTLRLEQPGLARIQTQGLARGAPFEMDYEARRGGACPGSGGD